jgi:Dyp-type peroxidase family
LSQPAIRGFGPAPFRGQQPIASGIIVLGGDSDNGNRTNAKLAKDGSFLVFRKLNQLVPEFNKWLDENGNVFKGGAEFLGARIVGRWKSGSFMFQEKNSSAYCCAGTPIDKAPFFDIPEIAKDPNQVNDFQYTFTNPDDQQDQTRCPFSAHLRKTNPRGDLTVPLGDEALARHRIIRQGITFGPEVTKEEEYNKKTKQERGLIFVSYQSAIADGFAFVQSSKSSVITKSGRSSDEIYK